MASADQFLGIARSEIGKPYVFGATGPSSFDCSGLVYYALRQIGLKPPRLAHEQEAWTQHVSTPAPGDLVFYGYGDNSHVAIYLGGGKVINAAEPGTNVRIQNVWQGGSSQPGPRYGRIPGLSMASGIAGIGLPFDPGGTGQGLTADGLAEAIGNISGQLKSFSDTMSSMLKAAVWLANPVNDIRILAGIWGSLIILAGLILLAFAA